MQVVYPVGSPMVCLMPLTRFSPVFGSTLFTDCSLFFVQARYGNRARTGVKLVAASQDSDRTEYLRSTAITQKRRPVIT